MQPTGITVPADRSSLEITWPDGLRQSLREFLSEVNAA